MPSHLPIELLRLILDNFACPPLSNDGTLDNPYRHELLSLCLTSKIFRQIAQPLLFAHIRFKDNSPAKVRRQLLCLIAQPLKISKARSVLLDGEGGGEEDETMKSVLANFCRACTELDTVIACSWGMGVHAFSGSSRPIPDIVILFLS